MAGLNRFEDFELSRKLQEAISSARLEKPTELQKQVIPPALDGCDVIFEARSGMGKSACFGIPFLQNWLRNRNQKGMIVTATADGVRQMGKVISRLCPALKTKVLKFTAKDDFFYPDLLARSPMAILELAVVERFIKREKEFASSVKMLGIDDFDKLLEHEERLSQAISPLSTDRQTLISAVELTEQVIERGRWYCDPNRLEKVKLTRPEAKWSGEQVRLQYMVVEEEDRFDRLLELLSGLSEKVVMIITDLDRVSRYVADRLVSAKIPAEVLAYSMQLDAKQSIAVTTGESGRGVMVGCEAALNGVNLPKVDHVISCELPSQIDSYWRRVDRFVHAGELGATLMVDQERVGAIRMLERRLGRNMEEVLVRPGAPERTERRERRPERSERAERPERREPPARPREERPHPAAAAETAEPQAEAVQAAPPVVAEEVSEQALIIPERFRMPVFATPEQVQDLAPEGFVKTLGSKFVPARKKR